MTEPGAPNGTCGSGSSSRRSPASSPSTLRTPIRGLRHGSVEHRHRPRLPGRDRRCPGGSTGWSR